MKKRCRYRSLTIHLLFGFELNSGMDGRAFGLKYPVRKRVCGEKIGGPVGMHERVCSQEHAIDARK